MRFQTRLVFALFAIVALTASLAAAADEKTDLSGFEPIFDGRTLDGWHELERAEGARWRVVDGVIVGDQEPGGHGGLLVTDRNYSDYELYGEVKTTYPLDTGFFLRINDVRNHYQVTIDYRPTGEVGALYGPFPSGGGYFQHCYEGVTWWDPFAWNPVRVRIEGDVPRIRVWIRGELVNDYQDTAVEGRPRFPRSGPIGIQVHGGQSWGEGSKVMFRNLRVRELE